MYAEKFHPVDDATLKYALQGKEFTQEERDFIASEVKKANDAQVRKFKVTLPDGEDVEFDNGQVIGGKNY